MNKSNKKNFSKNHQAKCYKKPKLIKYSKLKTIQASASVSEPLSASSEFV
jgi:hypothetical protein